MTNDASNELLGSVREHVVNEQPMHIVGGNSKAFLGCKLSDVDDAATVSLNNHVGVVNYEPTELVFTARSGTLLSDVVQTLKQSGQQLPFEPPQLPGATLGGTLACGLSGPARPYGGAARDHTLGVRVINGKGELLRFGGEVMKNVAGYDVSRVQVGAYGTLGLLLEVSLKVLPLPETTLTLAFEQNEHDTTPMVQLARRFLPVTAAALIGRTRYIRLAGSDAGVQAAAKELGGERVVDNEPWQGLRDLNHEFFNDPRPTWRISCADYTPALTIPNDEDGQPAKVLYDWGGAQRWIKTSLASHALFEIAANANAHATRFSTAMNNEPSHQPISGVSARLQRELRTSFDPLRLFNRSRFHPELDS